MTNMFAGVGMFSIMVCKRKMYSVQLDINPVASKLCEKNINQNKLKGESFPLMVITQ